MVAADSSETSLYINTQHGIRLQTTVTFMAEDYLMVWFCEQVGERSGWINYRSEFPDHSYQFLEAALWWCSLPRWIGVARNPSDNVTTGTACIASNFAVVFKAMKYVRTATVFIFPSSCTPSCHCAERKMVQLTSDHMRPWHSSLVPELNCWFNLRAPGYKLQVFFMQTLTQRSKKENFR